MKHFTHARLSSMDEDPNRLRVTAEKCRRLVDAAYDPLTVAQLTALAEECETKLSEMAEHPRDPSA